MKLILIFMSITKKKQANRNGRDYILLRINVKKQEALEKKFPANSSELIQAVVIKVMKLVEYKHLVVSLKTDNQTS